MFGISKRKAMMLENEQILALKIPGNCLTAAGEIFSGNSKMIGRFQDCKALRHPNLINYLEIAQVSDGVNGYNTRPTDNAQLIH
jgi:hypothetical protein